MRRLIVILFCTALSLFLGGITHASLNALEFCGTEGVRPTVGSPAYAPSTLSQLTTMTTRSEAVAVGTPNLRLSFTYDYAGRRATKTVERHVYGDWRELHRRQFVYSGGNLTAELLSDGRILRSYVWGEGQGDGIGGLLEIHDHLEQNTFYPAYDGNGNVISLTDADTKAIVATYTYGPFGQLLESTGAYARINPFRFSTRYTDNESGLLVYTHRYYDPETGRWLSRDPLGEAADDNLYRFAGNNPVDQVDLQGLLRYWQWEPITEEEYHRGVFRTRHQPYGLADIGQDRYFSYNPYNPNLPNIMRDAADAGARRALRELSQEHGVLLELDTYKLMAGEFSRAPFSFAVCMVAGTIEQAVETGKHWLDYTQYLKEGDLVSAQYTANYLATRSAPEIIAMAVTSGASNVRRAVPKTPKLLGPGSNFTPKINKQLPKRGWTQRRAQSVIDRPMHTSPALNRATGNKATAFFDKNGAYVVRDNVTGDIVQISNRLDPKWVPDPTITNPFIP